MVAIRVFWYRFPDNLFNFCQICLFLLVLSIIVLLGLPLNTEECCQFFCPTNIAQKRLCFFRAFRCQWHQISLFVHFFSNLLEVVTSNLPTHFEQTRQRATITFRSYKSVLEGNAVGFLLTYRSPKSIIFWTFVGILSISTTLWTVFANVQQYNGFFLVPSHSFWQSKFLMIFLLMYYLKLC